MANQHVVPHNGDWAVRRENASRVTVEAETQEEAFEIAKEIAENQGGEVFVHDRHGKIRARNTYGKPDPYPPEG